MQQYTILKLLHTVHVSAYFGALIYTTHYTFHMQDWKSSFQLSWNRTDFSYNRQLPQFKIFSAVLFHGIGKVEEPLFLLHWRLNHDTHIDNCKNSILRHAMPIIHGINVINGGLGMPYILLNSDIKKCFHVIFERFTWVWVIVIKSAYYRALQI